MESNQDDSMEDCLGMGSSDSSKELGKEALVTPIAAFHPELGHFTMDGCSDPIIQVIQEMTLNKEHNLINQSSSVSVSRGELGFANRAGDESFTNKDKGMLGNESQIIVHGADGPFPDG